MKPDRMSLSRRLRMLGACLPVTAALAAPAGDLPPKEATEQWEPVPPLVSAAAEKAPSDAVVLFDGRSLDAWELVKGGAADWDVAGDVMTVRPTAGHIRTKEVFGDIQLHLEFRTPSPTKGNGQSRGNSGVFFMGQYELQILDSHDNPTYVNGQAGSVYKQYPPLVNASRVPGEWQTYDAVFIAPRFASDGSLKSPARLTVFHNGVLVQYDVVLSGRTRNRGAPDYVAHPAELPLQLQDHKTLVSFRNIWARRLAPLKSVMGGPKDSTNRR